MSERTLGSGVEHVLNYLKRRQLENPGFLYAMEDDCGNVFWADPTCRLNYTYFGDTVVFDTMYRRGKRYQVPFAAFTGFNHHGQPLLFGCALILNESESSFAWLFHTWLQAMSAPPPPSITVEPDRLIQVAVSQVFCQTRLRFSQPLIFKETEEKLAHLYQSHPSFESEFINCVTETETAAEFEASWDILVRRYYLQDNDWLQSIYNARQQWVRVFIRDAFYGELSTNEESSSLNSFFQGFVDASTTMQTLIQQHDKAIDSWREKELKADYEAIHSTPVMKTPSPMEKQAASLYTRAAFNKFQDEFVETLANPASRISDSGTHTTYRVAKFGEVHKGHTVNFDALEVKAICSCQMFEYSGIICRHILAVFRANNVSTLPSRYLLRRWTKSAKTRGIEEQPEFSNSCQESLTVCFNNLRQEATKYVEEGAKSIQIYKVAMDALDEAAKKVVAASNKFRGATPGTTLPNGDPYPSEEARETTSAMNLPGERTILELTTELERTGQRCEVYRANLLSILRDMEEQKFQLSLKVQTARLSLKE
ncbi:PREDICTED: protein FAR1-RELATED SEQUENCE 9 isoform X2 [Camelina sativa]|uniref:Protein FAR1-RELATED SEQUENCE n=1 Tax=Camelina sativa TaxID=90675 RepID=A0ABM0U6Z3_CAMSA|nr:PREDICTED: protein FAR1-RELATED SEQUENCE 9 isoform X2 [Camelina sativa]